MRRIVIIICFGLVVFLFAGCRESVEYSFENSDVIAYVNGEPLEKSCVEQYIYFKTEYLKAVIQDSEPYETEQYANDDLIYKEGEINRITEYIIYCDLAREYLLLDNTEQTEDFYSSMIVRQKIEEKEVVSLEDIEPTIDYAVQVAYEDTPIYIDDTPIYISEIINNVAEKFNISYEECVENVFRLFITYETTEAYLLDYFRINEYSEEKVKYNGSNDEEYKKYIIDYFKEFQLYKKNVYIRAK